MNENKMIVISPHELELLLEDTVRKVMLENRKFQQQTESNSPLLLSLKEAAAFLKLAPQTIYGFTSKKLIPFLKRGKKLYFKRAELEEWLEAGKNKSVAQMNS